MKNLNLKKGFTLVELIVAIGLFLAVVSVGLGAVVNIYDQNNKTQSLTSVINNLNYSIDSMTRTIRFATTYHCGSSGLLTNPSSCDTGDTSLAISTSSTAIVYRFNNSNGKIEISNDSGATYKPVTGDEVTITYAKFYVLKTTKGDQWQPYVTMIIRGYAGSKPSTQSNFDIETTVSQRPLDI